MCSLCKDRIINKIILFCLLVIFGLILSLNKYIYLGLIFIFLPIMYFPANYILWRNGIYLS